MKSFSDGSLAQFLEELGSSAPVPGGGSAAALAGAMGAALCLMTCRLALSGKTRNNTPEEKAELERQAGRLSGVVGALARAADEDAASFDEVMRAMRLPRQSDEEKRTRSTAIQAAYKVAARVPLHTASLAAEALSISRAIVSLINPNALSDVGTGAALLAAAMDGAGLNVRINLSSIKDPAFVDEISQELSAQRKLALEAREGVVRFLAGQGLALD